MGMIIIPREIENNAYAKFWGANKVYYGQFENTECIRLLTDPYLGSPFESQGK